MRWLSGQVSLEASADLFVARCLATLHLGEAFLHLTDEPIVVVDQPFDGFTGQRLRISSPLMCDARELRLQISRQRYFHSTSVTEFAACAPRPALRRASAQEAPGTFSVCPGWMTLDLRPFASRMRAGVVP